MKTRFGNKESGTGFQIDQDLVLRPSDCRVIENIARHSGSSNTMEQVSSDIVIGLKNECVLTDASSKG